MTIEESSKMLIDGIVDKVREAMDAYIKAILATYRKEDGLSLSIPVKLTPGKGDTIQVEVGINFVESRIKDTFVTVVDLKQLPLGLEGRTYNMGGKGA